MDPEQADMIVEAGMIRAPYWSWTLAVCAIMVVVGYMLWIFQDFYA